MYLSGISVEIAGVTDALSRVRVGKDAVSRIARRLGAAERMAGTLFGGEGISLSVPGRHLPEGSLGGEG